MPSHEVDNAYPALQWFGPAMKRMMQRYVLTEDWWNDTVNVCRYAHVPIGNLEPDYPAFIADMFYARALR
jgi:DNA polymerase epsilon subunit 1